MSTPLEGDNRSAELASYRDHLVIARQKSQEAYDKTVVALSGGALGVSLAFLKDVIGSKAMLNSDLVFIAWICWGFSLLSILCSYFLSEQALTQAIKQVDSGNHEVGSTGGKYTRATELANLAGGLLFLAGVLSFSVFVKSNL